MPPTSSAAPADRAPAAATSERLREVPGGYDLGPLPIHVEVRDGESPVSWLRRVSWRYQVPARALLRDAGTRRRVTGTTKVAARLRNNRQLLHQLGLTEAEVAQLLKPSPLRAATAGYVTAFQRRTPFARPWFRYCPACLADPDPYWPDHWNTPLLTVCPTHHCYLLDSCPRCHHRPHTGHAWLSRPVELWRCPAPTLDLPDTRGARRRRPICTSDLRDAARVEAPDAQVAAQQLLLSWASDPGAADTVCGVVVTHRIGFDAFVDLVDAAAGSRSSSIVNLATDPAQVAGWLQEAAQVLTQPTLDQAAGAAAGLLSYDGPHAPTGPPSRLRGPCYNPLLGAVQLHGVRDQLPLADQLMFRTGHPEPRYPGPVNRADRHRLRLPGHHPNLPHPDPRWLPQVLWPDLLPGPGTTRCETPLRRAVLAMALAKVGSTVTWAEIADHLGLPRVIATNVGAVLQSLRSRGQWPATLATLDMLDDRLQQQPPPIDYQARRHAGQDTDTLTQALATAAATYPTSTAPEVLLRHFWEQLTGGDIAYAPDSLRLDPAGPGYRAYRSATEAGRDRNRPLLQVAHQHLDRLRGRPMTEPLTWTPAQTPAIYADDAVRLLVSRPAPPPAAGGDSPF